MLATKGPAGTTDLARQAVPCTGQLLQDTRRVARPASSTGTDMPPAVAPRWANTTEGGSPRHRTDARGDARPPAHTATRVRARQEVARGVAVHTNGPALLRTSARRRGLRGGRPTDRPHQVTRVRASVVLSADVRALIVGGAKAGPHSFAVTGSVPPGEGSGADNTRPSLFVAAVLGASTFLPITDISGATRRAVRIYRRRRRQRRHNRRSPLASSWCHTQPCACRSGRCRPRSRAGRSSNPTTSTITVTTPTRTRTR